MFQSFSSKFFFFFFTVKTLDFRAVLGLQRNGVAQRVATCPVPTHAQRPSPASRTRAERLLQLLKRDRHVGARHRLCAHSPRLDDRVMPHVLCDRAASLLPLVTPPPSTKPWLPAPHHCPHSCAFFRMRCAIGSSPCAASAGCLPSLRHVH